MQLTLPEQRACSSTKASDNALLASYATILARSGCITDCLTLVANLARLGLARHLLIDAVKACVTAGWPSCHQDSHPPISEAGSLPPLAEYRGRGWLLLPRRNLAALGMEQFISSQRSLRHCAGVFIDLLRSAGVPKKTLIQVCKGVVGAAQHSADADAAAKATASPRTSAFGTFGPACMVKGAAAMSTEALLGLLLPPATPAHAQAAAEGHAWLSGDAWGRRDGCKGSACMFTRRQDTGAIAAVGRGADQGEALVGVTEVVQELQGRCLRLQQAVAVASRLQALVEENEAVQCAGGLLCSGWVIRGAVVCCLVMAAKVAARYM